MAITAATIENLRAVPLDRIISDAGLEPHPRKKGRVRCPICGDTELAPQRGGTTATCWACRETFDSIELFRLSHGLEFYDACKRMSERYGVRFETDGKTGQDPAAAGERDAVKRVCSIAERVRWESCIRWGRRLAGQDPKDGNSALGFQLRPRGEGGRGHLPETLLRFHVGIAGPEDGVGEEVYRILLEGMEGCEGNARDWLIAGFVASGCYTWDGGKLRYYMMPGFTYPQFSAQAPSPQPSPKKGEGEGSPSHSPKEGDGTGSPSPLPSPKGGDGRSAVISVSVKRHPKSQDAGEWQDPAFVEVEVPGFGKRTAPVNTAGDGRPADRILNPRDLRKPVIYLVEGENDLLRVSECIGDTAAVGVVGLRGNPSDDVVERLAKARAGKKTYLVFDQDPAGREYRYRVGAAISDAGGDVRVIRW